MSLFASAVKKPITTALLFVAIAIFGIFSLVTLPIDLFPHIEGNMIMVMTSYSGASASDIENNISKPLENTLNSVSYLKHISSSSRENVSVVTLEFQYGRDIDVATNDVRDKLEMVKSYLPDGAGNPVIFKFSSDDIPILILSVTAKESMPGLYKIMDEKIVNELARVNGVGSVSVSGIPKREIMVLCDPYKLDAYNLTIESISSLIAYENQNIPGGTMDIGSNNYALRVQKEFSGAKEIENLVVGSYNGGNVYLKDVARIVDGLQERAQESYTNGQIGGMVIIQKQTGENSVQIVKKVNEMLPKLEQELPSDIKLNVIVDTTENIIKTIGSLEKTILITLLIVMAVVFIFLGRWRATVIILITIPISLLASLIYLYATGNTLNMISMSSLSIAIGMVVDAAIVVLENITTHIDRGSNPKQAAVYATNEVAMAVVASSATTLAVFLPMTLVSGLAGIMFRQLGWMVSIVITVSTLCALALTPMMCSTMMRTQNKQQDSKWFKLLFTPINKALDWLSAFYAKVLDWSLRHKRIVVAIAVALLAGVFAICLPNMKTEFVPEQDNGRISVTIQLPVGTRQEITRDLALELDKRWRAEFPEIQRLGLTEGTADSDNMFASMRSNGTHIISMNINVGSMEKRKRSIKEISNIMMEELAEYNQIKRFNVVAGGQQGGMGGQTVCQVDLYGYEFSATDEAAAQVSQWFKDLGVRQTVISRDDYVPEYQVDLDREKIAMYGLNTATVATFLRNRINGAIASEYRESGDEYDIRVRYAPEYRQSLQDIENITVYSNTGQAIKLSELGTIKEAMTPPTIQRKDRERYVSVTAPLPDGMAASDMNEAITAKIEEGGLPAGVSWKFGGTYDDMQSTFESLGMLMVLIVLLVFIVMAAQFESLTYPFVIMFAVPFAFVGVLIGLVLTNTPLSIMAMVGAVMTIGIVVNNGIVLVDYANLNRERGMGIIRAVVDSGHSRLRPVLMTTLTTVLGMLPLALGRGEGSEVWRGMGMTVAWGLSVSTVVTLIFVPVLYTIFAAFGLNRQKKKARKQKAEQDSQLKEVSTAN